MFKLASATEFVQSPSMEVLETCKKDMLMQISQGLQLEVKGQHVNMNFKTYF